MRLCRNSAVNCAHTSRHPVRSEFNMDEHLQSRFTSASAAKVLRCTPIPRDDAGILLQEVHGHLYPAVSLQQHGRWLLAGLPTRQLPSQAGSQCLCTHQVVGRHLAVGQQQRVDHHDALHAVLEKVFPKHTEEAWLQQFSPHQVVRGHLAVGRQQRAGRHDALHARLRPQLRRPVQLHQLPVPVRLRRPGSRSHHQVTSDAQCRQGAMRCHWRDTAETATSPPRPASVVGHSCSCA